ncbi:MAG: sulfurtransferase TusA family protein [Dehalococcoidia bacterium]|jgi:tRNA 2-thiouridine synthesizing protein A|nr:sulfurtransferase TusA family protein [Dehalococcoidia bacterium]
MAMKFEKTGDGTYSLDVKGYVCPHPQLYTKSALSKMKPGNTLRLVFDNASSGESIAAMVDKEGDELLEQLTSGGSYEWTIRKS